MLAQRFLAAEAAREVMSKPVEGWLEQAGPMEALLSRLELGWLFQSVPLPIRPEKRRSMLSLALQLAL